MAGARSSTETPMMRQYLSFKEKHPDAILFFRMGDFYEMFLDDAELAARELGLTLTTRDKGKANPIPMAGVPHHAAQGYLAKLIRRGYRVAVCEQVGEAGKGLVERRVIEVVTPGTAVGDDLVPETANNFVAAVVRLDGGIGVAAADVATGEFLLEDLPPEDFLAQVSRLPVAEWVLPEGETGVTLPDGAPPPVFRPAGWFGVNRGRRELGEHFGVHRLVGFDCETLEAGLGAGGALLEYLREVRGSTLPHIVRVKRLGLQDHMVLDEITRRNLELTESLAGEGRESTLIGVLDRTLTRIGARRLRTWLERPLLDRARIESRLDAVAELVDRPDEAGALGDVLGRFRDLERLLGKAACGKAGPRDLRSLGEGLAAVPDLREVLGRFRAEALLAHAELPDLSPLGRRLTEALVDEPPLSAGEGGVFREGWDEDLDEIRKRAAGGKEWIASLQESEREATGIPSLKVGFNKVFGYFLEVTAAHQAKVPDRYIRKQTLVNAERYVTPELKAEEERILGAEERMKARELELFRGLLSEVIAQAEPIQRVADGVGEVDAFQSLARVARESRFVRPRVSGGGELRFEDARHPVVERLLPGGEFVPNDLMLDTATRQIAVITGPNMAGKSTFLRQTGLLVILAQMGSFVPAAAATVGIVDRVFTRVGASDNIARGRSTFMVEMEETATILNAATGRSLVLLDEVGRGTSTYDGLSLAWAVTEHLHERPDGAPRTLFATHYHELTDLAGQLPRVINLTVGVREWNGKVVFLRRIEEGTADKSYGIHVAELAGLPGAVVDRARQILHRLESGRLAGETPSVPEPQLTLFEPVGHELMAELNDVDPERLSPIDALNLLHQWKTRFPGS